MRSVSDEFSRAPDKCQKCGAGDMLRSVSAPSGFILNGAGFYQNDFKNKR